MTLFKKIFDTHSQAIEKDEAAQSQAQAEAADLREVFVLPPEMRGLVEADDAETAAEEDAGWRADLEEPVFEVADEDDVAWPGEAPASRADAPALDRQDGETDAPAAISLADRAAEAQRQMMQTQARMEFQPAAPERPEQALPQATEGRAGRRAGRVKTRLLGFNASEEFEVTDPVQSAQPSHQKQEAPFPVGWIVVVKGPGRGHSFALHAGVTLIGRGEDHGIRLDFGDSSISRQNHAAIAYDDEQNSFFLGHGGKSNIIRLNNRPVLSTEEVNSGDLLRIGETTLRLVTLCGADFRWDEDGNDVA